ncbi:MAG: metal ABC transporter permease [Rhizobiaceae bacterium]|nr:metal ABC transporter permease [Rhizobiaceae bacterium]
MIEEFMLRAFLSGLALCLVTGPVGCFIIWKRMAYFGDTLAHSALLGVALALFLQIEAIIGVFVIAVGVSILLITLRRSTLFSNDTSLGILSHSALAIGLIAISLIAPGNISLNSLLFGDILAVSWRDVWVSFGVAIIILLILSFQWRALIAHTLSPDIAGAERIGSKMSEMLFMIMCSGLVAIAMKITGILLISALLILPAAIARIFSRSPEQMALLATLFGIASIGGGLFASLNYDLPSGPAIIVTSSLYFLTGLLIARLSAAIKNRHNS